MQVKPWTTHSALARVVVPARHGAHDVVERGDDEDDARRCRSDARARTRAALAAAERVRVTVDADGAVIAREREKSFRLRPFLHLTKMEAASTSSSSARDDQKPGYSRVFAPDLRVYPGLPGFEALLPF